MCTPELDNPHSRHRGIMAPPRDRITRRELRERAYRQIVDLDSYLKVSASLRREGIELDRDDIEGAEAKA